MEGEAAGEAAEVEADLEQASQLAETGDGVGAMLSLASQSQVANVHPEVPTRQLPFHGLTGAWAGQGRRKIQPFAGPVIRIACRPIDLVESRLPAFHPAPLFVPLPGFAIHHRGIEEGGGEFGEAPVAADGAGEGGQGLGHGVGAATTAREGADGGAGESAAVVAQGVAGRRP